MLAEIAAAAVVMHTLLMVSQSPKSQSHTTVATYGRW
ncbi:hypothetical protein PC116_g4487 [Phytophthora cactorum]|nr:hypothetical protein PC116_g4487 [Phytophthora cactorum]